MSDAQIDNAGEKWRLGSDVLAGRPTVFRNDLLAGQVFLVSGGGTGMGRVMTFLLARLGARVVICGRREAVLQETRDEVAEAVGGKVHAVPMSIREPHAVDRLMDETFSKFGRLDSLVNNAGGQFHQDAIEYSHKGWQTVIDLNLNGTWYMMQAAARRWRERKTPGSIVSIVAVVSRGLPQIAHTCAARAGVIGLTRSLAVEWAPLDIRVNCIAPGSISTEGLAVYPPQASARLRDANPLRRLGDPWDIAEGVVYLSAASGNFITGELLAIDGGFQMWGNPWPGGVPDHFNVV
ncbi:MAG: SDR family oxidoreductase [Rhodospirillaceae bacterium]|nr:SDR family oxidoreductase [Rhodospirillaceae bacterium]